MDRPLKTHPKSYLLCQPIEDSALSFPLIDPQFIMHTAILFIVATIAGVISSPLPPPSSLLSRECHFNRCPKTNLAGDEFSSSLIVRNTLVCRYVGSDDSCTYSTVRGLAIYFPYIKAHIIIRVN